MPVCLIKSQQISYMTGVRSPTKHQDSSVRYKVRKETSPAKKSGEPGLVDRVLALHAGSRGFDSHRGHMFERFFRSNRPGYPHPVSSELENSGIRVAVGDCSVTERRRWRPPYQTGKTVHMHAKNTTNTTRTDARRRVCAAMVPYR